MSEPNWERIAQQNFDRERDDRAAARELDLMFLKNSVLLNAFAAAGVPTLVGALRFERTGTQLDYLLFASIATFVCGGIAALTAIKYVRDAMDAWKNFWAQQSYMNLGSKHPTLGEEDWDAMGSKARRRGLFFVRIAYLMFFSGALALGAWIWVSQVQVG